MGTERFLQQSENNFTSQNQDSLLLNRKTQREVELVIRPFEVEDDADNSN